MTTPDWTKTPKRCCVCGKTVEIQNVESNLPVRCGKCTVEHLLNDAFADRTPKGRKPTP